MFDWDEVPDELGGPNQAAIDVEAEVERENAIKSSAVSKEPKKKASAAKTRPKAVPAPSDPSAQLCQAARAGSLMAVLRLLQAGTDANGESPDGRHPLQQAIASGSVGACAALLVHGSEAKNWVEKSPPGTPLRSLLELFAGRPPKPGELSEVLNSVDALMRPQVAQTIMTLAQSASTQEPAMHGYHASPTTPLSSSSSKSGAADITQSSSFASSSSQHPPEMPSSVTESRKAMPFRVEASRTPAVGKASEASSSRPPLHASSASSRPPSRSSTEGGKAVNFQTRPSGDEESALARAARAGNQNEIMALLNSRAEPNEYNRKGETPLFQAAGSENADAVVTLLLWNADPLTRSVDDCMPWDVTSSDAIRGLLRFYAGQELEQAESNSVLKALSEPTRLAIEHEMAERAANRRGLRTNEDMDANDEDAWATIRRPMPPLPAEVRAARDRLAAQELSQFPLACAAREGNLEEVLRLLVDVGVNPNTGDEMGETPLFEAAAAGAVDAVAALLLHRADPGHKSLSGATAVEFSSDTACKVLLSSFAGEKTEDEAKAEACRAIKDEDLQNKIANHFRAQLLRGGVLAQHLRRLRA